MNIYYFKSYEIESNTVDFKLFKLAVCTFIFLVFYLILIFKYYKILIYIYILFSQILFFLLIKTKIASEKRFCVLYKHVKFLVNICGLPYTIGFIIVMCNT
jgi:hypothetical protein